MRKIIKHLAFATVALLPAPTIAARNLSQAVILFVRAHGEVFFDAYVDSHG
jgi:hypothetical protein